MRKSGRRYSIGIDEVGRGCLAGPLYVAAVAMPAWYQVSGIRHQTRNGGKVRKILPLRDSKKLSPRQREEWMRHLESDPKIRWAVSRVLPGTIDKMNVARAANRAALGAAKRLFATGNIQHKTYKIYLDGGLFCGNRKRGFARVKRGLTRTEVQLPSGNFSALTVTRGDERIPAIALASIIAKVRRDRHMERLAKKYPAYGFEIHKGYGTKLHQMALRDHGPSDIHRLTFLGKYFKLGTSQ